MTTEFVDQPPTSMQSRMHRARLKAFVEEVRKHPGKWAVYPYPSTNGSARAIASRISRGKLVVFGEGFEATSNHGTVYVRYIGDER